MQREWINEREKMLINHNKYLRDKNSVGQRKWKKPKMPIGTEQVPNIQGGKKDQPPCTKQNSPISKSIKASDLFVISTNNYE